jgi:hypothetical protein
LLTPEIDDHSQAQERETYRPVSDREEDCGKGSKEDSNLCESFLPAKIDHFSLDIDPTLIQQRRENDKRDCRDEKYLREITGIITKRQKQSNLITDQSCPQTKNYRQVATQPFVAQTDPEPTSRNDHGKPIPEMMKVNSAPDYRDCGV